MSHAIDLLIVSQRHGGSGAALLDRDRFTARTRKRAAALAAFEERRPDCLVTCVETIPVALAARASRENCPVVDLPSEEAVDTDALAARITVAVDGAAGGLPHLRDDQLCAKRPRRRRCRFPGALLGGGGVRRDGSGTR
ncbi:MAG: hypothetical protein V5A56_02140 [Halolamina sp.]